ncbi:MAG: hypothetical protein ACRCYX_14150 [Dermatophilaceae bacterium]
MVTRPGGSADLPDRSAGIPDSADRGGDSGGVPVDLTVHTPGIDAAAVMYGDLAARSAEAREEARLLVRHEPLQNGESDDTWDTFGPGYTRAGDAIVAVLDGFYRVVADAGDGLRQQSRAYSETEQDSELVAESLQRQMETRPPQAPS